LGDVREIDLYQVVYSDIKLPTRVQKPDSARGISIQRQVPGLSSA
jgi:hypothetical protein